MKVWVIILILGGCGFFLILSIMYRDLTYAVIGALLVVFQAGYYLLSRPASGTKIPPVIEIEKMKRKINAEENKIIIPKK